MPETLRDAIGDGIAKATNRAAKEEWERRVREAQSILPQGWDVHVEPKLDGTGYQGRVSFLIEGGRDPFSVIDAVVAYFRLIQRGDPVRQRLVLPGDQGFPR